MSQAERDLITKWRDVAERGGATNSRKKLRRLEADDRGLKFDHVICPVHHDEGQEPSKLLLR
jgi:hypothetical protein